MTGSVSVSVTLGSSLGDTIQPGPSTPYLITDLSSNVGDVSI